ncbi:MAG: NAD(P)-dependent oxidoreductase [Burkholderiales bacterium]
MQVAILGATGVLGRPVIARLLDRGHEVVAVARDPAKLATHPRVHAVRGDILCAETLAAPLAGCDAVLHLATVIPRTGTQSDWSANDRVRSAGTRNLLAAARSHGRPRYVQQSVAMLLVGPRDVVADEDAPVRPSPRLESARDMEHAVRESDLPWVILRGGAFYGRGSDRMEYLNRLARDGQLAVPGDGGDYVSLVHVDDMADAVVRAAESDIAAQVFNVVDDCPVTYRELYEFVASVNAAPPPASDGPPLLPSFRVSNERARRVLGWRPRFPDYRAGWTID